MPALRPESNGLRSSVIETASPVWGGRRGNVERLRLAIEIFVAYLLAQRELRRAPISAALARLRARAGTPSAPPAEALEHARSLGWIVTRVLIRLPGDTRCLVRSLVLTQLLARRGIPAKLVIGTRTGPDFLAHAWVECAGTPVLAPGDDSFGRLVEL